MEEIKLRSHQEARRSVCRVISLLLTAFFKDIVDIFHKDIIRDTQKCTCLYGSKMLDLI